MALEIVRRIRGNIHGSIDVTELENRVMAHPYFQRLRRIRQLAFLNYVFPGATHTRFEHSLGVMHLAGVAWSKLQSNQQRLERTWRDRQQWLDEPTKGSGLGARLSPTFDRLNQLFGNDYVLQCFRLAGLLHDIGHPPFSHSGERFLPSMDQLIECNPCLPTYMRQYLEDQRKRILDGGGDPAQEPVRHEVMSALLIVDLMAAINEACPKDAMMVDPQDIVALIIEAIPPAVDSPLMAMRAFRVCRELISGELDIDRMDYLLRDSRECGVVYGIFDAGRILDSLYLYYSDKDDSFHIAVGYSGLAAFEDYLRARHSMYLQLYFHKTSVSCEAALQEISHKIPDYRLPAHVKEYAQIDENSILQQMQRAAQDTPAAEEALQLASGVLLHRRLWKRVYEVSRRSNEQEASFGLETAKAILQKNGIAFQQVSSRGSLTRFQPEKNKLGGKEYLRLIKKDHRQIPQVQPLEAYSDLIKQHHITQIDRLYVDPLAHTPVEVIDLIRREMRSHEQD